MCPLNRRSCRLYKAANPDNLENGDLCVTLKYVGEVAENNPLQVLVVQLDMQSTCINQRLQLARARRRAWGHSAGALDARVPNTLTTSSRLFTTYTNTAACVQRLLSIGRLSPATHPTGNELHTQRGPDGYPENSGQLAAFGYR